MRLSRLVPSLRCLLLAGAGLVTTGLDLAAAEPERERDLVIATPWAVRQKADELLRDLADARLERPVLLDRTRALLIEHGDELITYQGAWIPLAEALRRHLVAIKLAEPYAAYFQEQAERELRTLGQRRGARELSALASLATVYPGTTAGRQALRELVDQAWDRGLLGLYLLHASGAGEAEDAQRSARLAAAQALLLPPAPEELPASLDAYGPMWSVRGIPNRTAEVTTAAPDNQVVRQRQNQPTPASCAFSRGSGGVAVTDGLSLVVVDPLVGNQSATPVPVGSVPLPYGAQPPVAAGEVFVVTTLNSDSRPQLVAIDREGHERWRQSAPPGADTQTPSAPAVVGDTVAYAYTRFNDSYAELHLVAYALADGAPRWQRLVAKSHSLQHPLGYGESMSSPPDLILHRGTWVLCANNGLLARVAANGQVMGIWTYPTVQLGEEDLPQLRDMPERASGLVSDGSLVVATPVQSAVTVVLEPDSGQLRLYHGNGAQDRVVDAVAGQALLVGRRVSLLDLSTLQTAWSVPGSPEAREVDGRLDGKRALALMGDRAVLKDGGDGRNLSSLALPREQRYAMAEGVLLAAGPDPATAGKNLWVVGHGDQQGSDRLLAKIAAHPDDPRPLLALGSLQQARGDLPAAYATILKALALGAPPRHADDAARLARITLDRSLATERFPTALAQLQDLERYTGSIRAERLWWQGLHAELTNAAPVAAESFHAVLQEPRAAVTFTNGLEADLHVLAEAGLHRLSQTSRPGWSQGGTATTAQLPAGPVGAPPPGFLEAPLSVDGQWFGYRAGHLACYPVGGDQPIWKRQGGPDDSPRLGVYNLEDPEGQPGVLIAVVPGSAAEAAGIRTGDRVLSLDGTQLDSFASLARIVGAKHVDAPFRMEVTRDGETQVCTGQLGSYMMRAIAVHENHLLVRTIAISHDNGRFTSQLSNMNPMLEVLDRRTGSVLWRRHLHPTDPRLGERSPEPQLLGGRWLLTTEGQDLVCFDLAAAAGSEAAWTLPGAGDGQMRREALSEAVMLLSRQGSGRIQLRELATGRMVFALDADPDGPVLIHGGRCHVRGITGRLACWDLGKGRLAWQSEDSGLEPVALHQGQIYARDRRRQLLALDTANGKVARRFSSWTTVHEVAAAGDRLFLHAADAQGHSQLAAISLQSGEPEWSVSLPAELEVIGPLLAWSDGVACTLGALGESRSGLILDRNGRVVSAENLGTQGALLPGAGAPLVHGVDANPRAPLPLPVPTPATAAPPRITEGTDLEATLAAAEPALTWTNLAGGGSWALAWHGASLLAVARFAPGDIGVRIHLGDSSEALDTGGHWLDLAPQQAPTFHPGQGQWKLGQSAHAPAADGSWLSGALIEPPAVPPAGAELLAQIRVIGNTAPAPLAWWYRPAWIPLRQPAIIDPSALAPVPDLVPPGAPPPSP